MTQDRDDEAVCAMVAETAEKLFTGRGGGAFDATLWREVQEAGLPLALLDETAGGVGLSARAAFLPVGVAAAHAVALPLGETMLANWALARARLAPLGAAGAIAWSQTEGKRGDAGGPSAPVAFGRHLEAVVLLREDAQGLRISLLRPDAQNWREGCNHASEPRDTLVSRDAPELEARLGVSPDLMRAALAMLRVVQMAGAIEAVAAMCLRYCHEREQFGQPLGRFQAIQHQLAIMAGHGCAANTAAAMALAAFDAIDTRPDAFLLTAAAAKVRAAEAATAAASIAHQVHGAIGFSQEYPLHPLTRRLWSWRDEDGSESYWAAYLARWAEALPVGGLWPAVTQNDLMRDAS